MKRDRTTDSRPSTDLGRLLHDNGALDPDWGEAFDNVPRSAFLPDRVWAWDTTTGQNQPIDRVTDPAAWQAAADADIPLVTQWDDGPVGAGETGTVPTSSVSMPSVVARMFRDLRAPRGSGLRTLIIGTGLGWTDGLAADQLGDENVLSIEIDALVAARARTALVAAGYRHDVIRGDGAVGWADGTPYDRILVTAGVRSIPAAWLEQTRPGGIIVAPWGTDYAPVDAVVQLTVHPDGTAAGRFTGLVEFMKLRDQRLAWPDHAERVKDFPGGADRSDTGLALEQLGHGFDTIRFVTGLCVRDCAHAVHVQDDGTKVAWFYGLSDRSWAAAIARPDAARVEVYQHGPRRLWDEVELAVVWWHAAGCPKVTEFGLTVAPSSEASVWFEDPGFELKRRTEA